MTATFMPKPFTDRTGSGLHLHLSLWRDDEPLFPELDDPRGLGLSKTAYSFLAGVLEHACGLSAVIAPTAARQRDEFLDWHAAVSPAEVDRYLTAF
jgi:glutamine synthetase